MRTADSFYFYTLNGYTMPTKRPTSVLVIAIFHFIFGGFGLIAGLVGVGFGTFAVAQPPTPPGYMVTSNPPDVMDTMHYMDATVPGWHVVNLTFAVLGLGISIALLVGRRRVSSR